MSFGRKIFQNLNRKGWRKIRRRIDKFTETRRYRQWLRRTEEKSPANREKLSAQSSAMVHKPLISIILPVYNVKEKWLRRCLDSVLNQIYKNWELCVADDCSPAAHIKKVLDEYARRDNRLKIVYRTANGHISAASNSALELANGEFCALLDHDDELAADALFRLVEEINHYPDAELIYSDEDMIDERGRRYEPKFKPDWSRDLFYSLNLITHLAAYRTATLRAVGGWRVGCEGSQDYELTLRFIERIDEKNIRHIPRILYHWRAIRGSVALDGDEKPYAHERAREAIRAHLKRIGKSAQITPTVFNLHRVRYDLPQPPPKVSLLMLIDEDSLTIFRDLEKFIAETDYPNFEIVMICTSPTREKNDIQPLPANVRIIVCENISRAERYNAAAREIDGEVLLFVDESLRPVAKEWLREIVGFAIQKEIGAAGAKILSADETIRHGGVVLGIDNLIGDAHRGLPRELPGNMGRAQLVGNFSAISIECLATRREVFQAAGGFDAKNFPGNLFGVDFCLRLREKNLRVVWTPYAELIEVKNRARPISEMKPNVVESGFFKTKWGETIERDPFYNPNFSRRKKLFTLET